VKIDPVKKTITFEEGVTVTSDQLRWLLSIVDGPTAGSGFPVEISVPHTYWPPKLVKLVKMTTTRSYAGTGHVYIQVRMSDGSLACSCPDWIYRRSNVDELVHPNFCKHLHGGLRSGRL
jgi:hypothetical protein